MRNRRLLVLGAGPGQVPIIRTAVAAGVHVITLDNVPENVGHQLAADTVHCSTVDADRVLRFALDLRIDGIVTMASDVAVPTLGYVAERLGLSACSHDAAATMAEKTRFRAFQARRLPASAPRFVAGSAFEDVFHEVIATLAPPVVFKPADTSGSRGISQVDTLEEAACRAAFDFARGHARSGRVCVEAYVEGQDISGDGFLTRGQLFAVMTRKYRSGFTPTGHELPAPLSEPDQARVRHTLETICQMLGYATGPIDFDVVVSPDRVVVIEMSPRLGGNGIPQLVERATGVDLVRTVLANALGEKIELPRSAVVSQRCGSWVFGSARGGTLRRVASPADLYSALPFAFDYEVLYQTGDAIPPFAHSGNRVGHVLFDLPEGAGYEETVARIARVVGLSTLGAA